MSLEQQIIEVASLVLLTCVILGLVMSLFISNMLPASRKTCYNVPFMTDFTDVDYALVMARSLVWDASDGLDARKDALFLALCGAASYDEIKDWQDAEITAIKTYLITLLAFCQEYVAQRNIRKVCAHYCAKLGDDTKAIWTDASWETFNMIWDRLPLPLMSQFVALVELMNPVVRLSAEIAERNIPPAHLMYFIPTKTYAQMMALRATLLGSLRGITWLKKTQLPIGIASITRACNLGPRIISPSVSSEWIYWYTMPSYSRKSGTLSWFQAAGAPKTTSSDLASTIYRWLPPTEPHPLYSLRVFMEPYVATYNTCGCLVGGDTADNFPGLTYGDTTDRIIRISFNSTTTTVALTDFTWTGTYLGTMLDQAPDADSCLIMGYQYQTTGIAAWESAHINALTTMFTAQHGAAVMKQRQQKGKNQGGKRYGKKPKKEQGRGRPAQMGNRREDTTPQS